MRWQYELVHTRTLRWVVRPNPPPFMDETLTERREDGWDLVAALPCDHDDVALIFRRQLSQDSPVLGFNLALCFLRQLTRRTSIRPTAPARRPEARRRLVRRAARLLPDWLRKPVLAIVAYVQRRTF